MVAVVLLPLAFVLVGGGTASADPYSRLREHWVDAPGGVGQIKVRMWLANNGSNNKALYLLDGLRATDDVSGWEHETNAAWLSDHGITVVEAVGGESSFYTDWMAPSNLNGQQTTYKWETFLTRDLPNYLETRGVSRNNNGMLGLSMGGSAAMTLAAHHRDQFTFAGSLSGYLNLSAPGMREAIRVAMLDAGRYNVDSMWGPPWSPAWLRNDPFVQASSARAVHVCLCGAAAFRAPTISRTPRSSTSTPRRAWDSRHWRWPTPAPSRSAARHPRHPRALRLSGDGNPQLGLLAGPAVGDAPDDEGVDRRLSGMFDRSRRPRGSGVALTSPR